MVLVFRGEHKRVRFSGGARVFHACSVAPRSRHSQSASAAMQQLDTDLDPSLSARVLREEERGRSEEGKREEATCQIKWKRLVEHDFLRRRRISRNPFLAIHNQRNVKR